MAELNDQTGFNQTGWKRLFFFTEMPQIVGVAAPGQDAAVTR